MTSRGGTVGTKWKKAIRSKIPPKKRFLGQLMWNSFSANGFLTTIGLINRVNGLTVRLGTRYGVVLQNLIMSIAGMWNGCKFCAVNHLYTANFAHFRKTGNVLPLGETEILELQALPFPELMEHLRVAFSGPEWAEHWRVIERFFQMYSGEKPATDEDKLLFDTVEGWKWVNECSLPISIDLKLDDVLLLVDEEPTADEIAAYQRARQAWLQTRSKAA